MGLNPIEYRPWKGERAPSNQRFYVIAKNIVQQKLRSKAVMLLLILGIPAVHALPLIAIVLFPSGFVPPLEIMRAYLQSGLFPIFTILLVSVVSGDLISEDISDNSFVMYFSRPINTRDYLAGKIMGALFIMGGFCFALPTVVSLVLVSVNTEILSGGEAIRLVGGTMIAGLISSFVFIPFCIMLSSFTKRRAYATIGAFMSFFVLTLVGALFYSISPNWELISPIGLLNYTYDILYGTDLPSRVSPAIVGLMLLIMVIVPLLVTYGRVKLMEEGK